MQSSFMHAVMPGFFSFLRRIAVALAFLLAAGAGADEEKAVRGGILLELFTSQGCYSCPPADDLLRTVYNEQAQLIPLEFHVHYWDDLVYGFSGSWKDPFSSPYYTDRQRDYNRSIRDTASMYTPQMVVQGRAHAVGSKRSKIDRLIADTPAPAYTFYFTGDAPKGWRARIDGALQGGEELYYAIYHREETTRVTAGENKGKDMINSNVVKTYKRHSTGGRHISVPSYDPQKEGCAVWIQKPQTGAVLAAARCPQRS